MINKKIIDEKYLVDATDHTVDYYESTFKDFIGTVTTIRLTNKTIGEIRDVRRQLR